MSPPSVANVVLDFYPASTAFKFPVQQKLTKYELVGSLPPQTVNWSSQLKAFERFRGQVKYKGVRLPSAVLPALAPLLNVMSEVKKSETFLVTGVLVALDREDGVLIAGILSDNPFEANGHEDSSKRLIGSFAFTKKQAVFLRDRLNEFLER